MSAFGICQCQWPVGFVILIYIHINPENKLDNKKNIQKYNATRGKSQNKIKPTSHGIKLHQRDSGKV